MLLHAGRQCGPDSDLDSFSTQYEYSPSYNDFGHTDGNEHFFAQMDFLTPQLLRVLKPGRLACIHVKDPSYQAESQASGSRPCTASTPDCGPL